MSKEIDVCFYCGSADLKQDAWVHVNNSEDVSTFDDIYCEVCESSVKKVVRVEVPDDFDVYSDIHEETANANHD